MAQKIYDAAVKVGEYQKDGETKGRYLNVGAVLKGENGPYLLLDRTFNPAGVANPEARGNVIVSLFQPKQEQAPAPAPQQQDQGGGFQDDSIPF